MQIVPFEKSFASHEKAIYWSNKNGVLPKDVYKSTHKKYWFNCDKCNHNFIIALNSVNNGNWCCYCSNTKLCDDNNCELCFEKSFASHEKSKYWSNENKENPREVFKSSHSKYWFKCDKCNHKFDAIIYNLKQLNNNIDWCPYCINYSNKLCYDNNCKLCFEKSFASNEKSKYWSNENKEKPREVFKSSNNKYWFNCLCSHSFESKLNDINNNNRWCPYCCYPPIKLCDNEKCEKCFEKSFASHKKSINWSDKNIEKPREVFKSSSKRYWFNCICNHLFNKTLTSISNGCWCPFCTNQKLCDDEKCQICFNKSFASNEKNIFWSDKNIEKPREVFNKSSKKYWFNCDRCNNEFDITLNHVNSGSWCRYCINKTEYIFYEKIKLQYPSIIHQFKIDWCKNINYLPFDFCILENNIIIEIDGPQHFYQVSNWKTPEEQFLADKYKEQQANKNNFSTIRILQEDIYYNIYDWYKEICEKIEEIIKGNKIINVYLCKNNEYKNYI